MILTNVYYEFTYKNNLINSKSISYKYNVDELNLIQQIVVQTEKPNFSELNKIAIVPKDCDYV